MSKSYIRFVQATYRAEDISGEMFELVAPFKRTNSGGYVTVVNGGRFPDRAAEMRVNITGVQDYEFVTEAEFQDKPLIVNAKPEPATTETDEQAIARIRERFEILDEMAKAATNGDIRAMIVSGPPGVGKSYGVEQVVEKVTLFDTIAGRKLRAEVVKGSITPIGLYSVLYKYSDPNCVLVFDDADTIFFDDVSLNLLKGALDSGKKRRISWLADSNLLRREGIPESFNFQGSVIFITNLKFSNVKSKKLQDHLEALESRCHFIDLQMDTVKDKLLRIKQIVADGMLDGYDFDQVTKDEIMEFIDSNQSRLREISLRSALKTADLRKAFPTKWKSFAETSLLKQS